MNENENFIETKECTYKGETYLVRDNGAIFRKSIDGKKVRPLDNNWTFGKYNEKRGYALISGVPVHRIVATAFLGEPKSSDMVVDHIDTNRRNNRPTNLRWLTKLENVVLNNSTRKKIEYICGVDIYTFLENTSKYRDKFNDPQFKWMRAVTEEEALNCKNNIEKFVNDSKKHKATGNGFNERIFKDNSKFEYSYENMKEFLKEQNNLKHPEFLQNNVDRKNWIGATKFVMCPDLNEEQTLEHYYEKMEINKTFCISTSYKGILKEKVFCKDLNCILLINDIDGEGPKNFGLAKITFENGKFIHTSLGTFFEEKGAYKYFAIEQGLEWTGGECFDDYC